jgi:uncharacterized protein (TIGR03118 family)
MRLSTRNLHHTVLEGKHKQQTRKRRPAVEGLEERALLSASHALAVHEDYSDLGYIYTQYNLVSNIRHKAPLFDRRLVNPWDVNFPQKPQTYPPVIVADQGTGVATSYWIKRKGRKVIVSKSAVTIPTVGSSEPGGPTGLVQNTSGGFKINGVPATYIVATLQGTIEGIEGFSKKGNITNTTSAEIMVDNSSTGAEYTGLAAGTFNGQPYIYAANEGTNPGIQVFDGSFHQVALGVSNFEGTVNGSFFGNFIDPILPAGFMPYGVKDLSLGAGSKQEADLFVTYRAPNFQGGAVAVFTNNGEFLGQIASDTTSGGNLQSPWGLAYIGQGLFGDVGGDLLVGNYSSGQIDAYTVTVNQTEGSAEFQGELTGTVSGAPLIIPGLRSIHFGPGLWDPGHPQVALLFTADAELDTPQSRNYSLYGEITPSAPPAILHHGCIGDCGGGTGQPYVLVGNGSGVLPVETRRQEFDHRRR